MSQHNKIGVGPDWRGRTLSLAALLLAAATAPAVSGRYLAGPGLDMTARFGFSGTDRPGVVQSEFDGWALVTGLRLSF